MGSPAGSVRRFPGEITTQGVVARSALHSRSDRTRATRFLSFASPLCIPPGSRVSPPPHSRVTIRKHYECLPSLSSDSMTKLFRRQGPPDRRADEPVGALTGRATPRVVVPGQTQDAFAPVEPRRSTASSSPSPLGDEALATSATATDRVTSVRRRRRRRARTARGSRRSAAARAGPLVLGHSRIAARPGPGMSQRSWRSCRRPIRFAPFSVNQRSGFPPRLRAIWIGRLSGVGTWYSRVGTPP
jgi:hypothetical protein